MPARPSSSRRASACASCTSEVETRRLFGIDLRALAALRIGLGFVLLYDLMSRARSLEAHYGGSGVAPLEALRGPSLYACSGSPIWAAMLFLVAALLAMMLVAGYHTWLATSLSWFLLASLQTRNPLLNNAGDQLLAFLLFWGMFLPLGVRASVDARTSPPRSAVPGVVLSIASVALLLQVVLMYTFTSLFKSPSAWVVNGTAVHDALSLDLYARPLGHAMLRYPGFVKMASRVVYFLELCGPLLVFVPVFTSFIRTAVALAFMIFHLSLHWTMSLDIFAFVCIVAWLPFLPGAFWNRVLAAGIVRGATLEWRDIVGRIAARIASAAPRHRWLVVPPVAGRASMPGRVLAGATLLYVLAWNLGTWNAKLEMPASLAWFGRQFYLAQEWRMFAPSPPIEDGWWEAPAKLEDGSEIELLTGAPTAVASIASASSAVPLQRPRFPLGRFAGPRWRKYFEGIGHEENRGEAKYFAAWLRRQWNAHHEPQQRIARMQLYYGVEVTPPDSMPPTCSRQLVYDSQEMR